VPLWPSTFSRLSGEAAAGAGRRSPASQPAAVGKARTALAQWARQRLATKPAASQAQHRSGSTRQQIPARWEVQGPHPTALRPTASWWGGPLPRTCGAGWRACAGGRGRSGGRH
jgi:hypothetical protein